MSTCYTHDLDWRFDATCLARISLPRLGDTFPLTTDPRIVSWIVAFGTASTALQHAPRLDESQPYAYVRRFSSVQTFHRMPSVPSAGEYARPRMTFSCVSLAAPAPGRQSALCTLVPSRVVSSTRVPSSCQPRLVDAVPDLDRSALSVATAGHMPKRKLLAFTRCSQTRGAHGVAPAPLRWILIDGTFLYK